MNENIDLTKILKDCPMNWKLYSLIHGEVQFRCIDNSDFPIVVELSDRSDVDFTEDGRLYREYDGECVLLPSKDQRDWSKFSAHWYKLEKQGDLSQTNKREWLYLVSDVLTWKDGIGQYLDDPRVQELAKRLCSKYAQKLYNPSNTEKNKQKFDPKTLQPFDRVLVRTNSGCAWEPDFFGYIDYDRFMCVATGYVQCIPYNDDTKHLVGTTNEAPEYYRYWEE